MTIALGIDVGGSGIKGAPVDLDAGEWAEERLRIPTPGKSTPKNVLAVITEIVDNFASSIGDAPVGIAFPAPVRHGHIPMIANLDQKWVGLNVGDYFSDALGREVIMVNDADAAGLAEVHYGAAKGFPGVVVTTTLGTGIGSAVFVDGNLVPNTEFGHLEIDGHDAESRAASSVKDKEGLSYKEWAVRLQRYYETLTKLLWPDLIVVGGGVSREHEKFLPLLDLDAEIVPAKLRNRAGIIGAAWWAAHHPATVDPEVFNEAKPNV